MPVPETPELESPNHVGRAAIVVAIAVIMLAAMIWPFATAPALLSSLWSEDLAAGSDEAAPAHLRRLAQLGEEGIPPLVEALGSPREVVAHSAREVLRDELARWRLLRAEESTPLIARLVECLAERNGRWHPDQRRVAAELAQEALAWQCAGDATDRTLLVERCESILRLATQSSPPRYVTRAVTTDDELADNPRGAFENSSLSAGDQVRGVAYEELASLPGGDLPFDIAQMPALAAPFDPLAISSQVTPPAELASQPPRLIQPREARPLTAKSPGSPPQFTSQDAPPLEWPLAPPVAELAPDEARPNLPARVRPRIDTQEIRLMRQLIANDSTAANEAAAELTQRGFDGTTLAIARRLVDPDPAVRLALCRELPSVPRLDARPWLLWLADDPDAGVRELARGILATSGDPALSERLERLQELDRTAGLPVEMR